MVDGQVLVQFLFEAPDHMVLRHNRTPNPTFLALPRPYQLGGHLVCTVAAAELHLLLLLRVHLLVLLMLREQLELLLELHLLLLVIIIPARPVVQCVLTSNPHTRLRLDFAHTLTCHVTARDSLDGGGGERTNFLLVLANHKQMLREQTMRPLQVPVRPLQRFAMRTKRPHAVHRKPPLFALAELKVQIEQFPAVECSLKGGRHIS